MTEMPTTRSIAALRAAAGDPAEAEKAARFLCASLALSTQKAYAADWSAFSEWCDARALDPTNTAPEIVAVYLSMCAEAIGQATLQRRLSSIRNVRRRLGVPLADPSGLLTDMQRGIARTVGTPPHPKAPLTADLLAEILAGIPDTRAGRRDRALLLLGYAGALRRSELVGLDVDHVRIREDCVRLELCGGKSDPTREGSLLFIDRSADPSTCPVRALERWMRIAGLKTGPLFRGVNRHDRVRTGRLGAGSVARIVKRHVARWAAAQGLEPEAVEELVAEFAGHSLRRGFVSQLTQGKAPDALVQQQTRHKDLRSLHRYAEMTEEGRRQITELRGL